MEDRTKFVILRSLNIAVEKANFILMTTFGTRTNKHLTIKDKRSSTLTQRISLSLFSLKAKILGLLQQALDLHTLCAPHFQPRHDLLLFLAAQHPTRREQWRTMSFLILSQKKFAVPA